MSGRGQAVVAGGGGADFEVVRFVVPYPDSGAITGLTGQFYVPQDVSLGDVIITLVSPSAHTLVFEIKYCRNFPTSTTFNTLSGNMSLSSSTKMHVFSPTWADDLQAGDYLRLDQVSGDGTDASLLEVVVLKAP